MRDDLQTILVPPPSPASPGEMVPFADPPIALTERKEPLVIRKSYFTHILWAGIIALLVYYGLKARRHIENTPEEAAEVILWAALFSGTIGLVIFLFMALSKVPEFRHNELFLVFPFTDLGLAHLMWRFRKQRITRAALASPWLVLYAHLRLALVALAVLGHLFGILYQKPRIVLLLGCVDAAVVWILMTAHARSESTRLAR